MLDDQCWNVVVAEFRTDEGLATVTCAAETVDDDAIQMVLDALTDQGIGHDNIVRLYSERRPSDGWNEYFADQLPNVAVTWSFEQEEEAEIESAIERALQNAHKPWWKFW